MHHLQQLINEKISDIIQIRRKLHQAPELKFEEFKTSKLVSDTLHSFGIEQIETMAGTGVIAIIDSGKPGKVVALRADLDALPIHEETGLEYQSQHENVMHACGHDGHTATLLLTAFLLQQIKHEFTGKVKLIFQPAEEGGKGSTVLIENGVLANPTVDAIFGWHIWPGLPLNSVATKSGTLLAGNGRFEIEIRGRVAHMSMPHLAVNPVTIGAELITAIDSLREHYADSYKIINVIRIECGAMKGGMTDSAKIIGVYFIENDACLTEIKSDIENIINQFNDKTEADINVSYRPFHTPTINTPAETTLALTTARDLFSSDSTITLPAILTASEDFSEYLKHVPGCFYLIGAGENSASVHTNAFDFPDQVLASSALLMTAIARNYLNQE